MEEVRESIMGRNRDFGFEEIWIMARGALGNASGAAVRVESATLAETIHNFGTIFDNDLKTRFGVDFQIHEFLKKFLLYVSNSAVGTRDKIRALSLFYHFVDTSESPEQAQTLLNKIGTVKTILLLFTESKMEDSLLISHILDLLAKLLEGGFRPVQRSIFQFFQSEPKHTASLFNKISVFLSAFNEKMTGSTEVSDSSVFESQLKVIEKLLVFLQMMCEGHYEDLQNYLRNQQNLRKKHNFLEMVCLTMRPCVENPKNQTFRLFQLCLDFLVEMLQGPCLENQKALLELNLVSSLMQVLEWRLNSENTLFEASRNPFEAMARSQAFRLKRISRAVLREEISELEDREEMRAEGKRRMKNSYIVKIKYKSVIVLQALTESQREKSALAKMKKELDYKTLKKLVVEVYSDFVTIYKGRYVVETLNNVGSSYLV